MKNYSAMGNFNPSLLAFHDFYRQSQTLKTYYSTYSSHQNAIYLDQNWQIAVKLINER